MQRITPFFCYDGNAEEAVKFYLSVFKNSKITTITRCGEAGPGPVGSVLTIAFMLDGQEFVALNGGPAGQFTQSISFVVNCDTQDEVDYYWAKLTEGGKEVACGWLEDKFGMSWQIVPTIFMEMLNDPDPAKTQRGMKAMMNMIKLDINALKEAMSAKD